MRAIVAEEFGGYQYPELTDIQASGVRYWAPSERVGPTDRTALISQSYRQSRLTDAGKVISPLVWCCLHSNHLYTRPWPERLEKKKIVGPTRLHDERKWLQPHPGVLYDSPHRIRKISPQWQLHRQPRVIHLRQPRHGLGQKRVETVCINRKLLSRKTTARAKEELKI